MNKNTLLIMAGGTGGHIFPGLAIAQYMRERSWQVFWLGNLKGMEANLVPKQGFPILGVSFGGVRGKGLLRAIFAPFALLLAAYQSYKILRKIRPNVVLGMGGYISLPGGLVTRILGIPLVIHEQNTVPGWTNRILAHIATYVLCAFPNVFSMRRKFLQKIIKVGNPIHLDFFIKAHPQERYQKRFGKLRVLVVGGSRGARAINQLLPQALALLSEEKRPEIIHQSGNAFLNELKNNYAQTQVNASIHAFIENMADAYANADLVICRSGAMTVAEIAAIGVAAIFIPFPFAVDDHQTKNAKVLVETGAAILQPQSEVTPEVLANLLAMLDRKQLLNMAIIAKQKSEPHATAEIAKICTLAAMPGCSYLPLIKTNEQRSTTSKDAALIQNCSNGESN